jgi:hypothetical protein
LQLWLLALITSAGLQLHELHLSNPCMFPQQSRHVGVMAAAVAAAAAACEWKQCSSLKTLLQHQVM